MYMLPVIGVDDEALREAFEAVDDVFPAEFPASRLHRQLVLDQSEAAAARRLDSVD